MYGRRNSDVELSTRHQITAQNVDHDPDQIVAVIPFTRGPDR
jgi:hypothetical protein